MILTPPFTELKRKVELNGNFVYFHHCLVYGVFSVKIYFYDTDRLLTIVKSEKEAINLIMMLKGYRIRLNIRNKTRKVIPQSIEDLKNEFRRKRESKA